MKKEQESFWDAQSLVVVTDKTKPAMKWTIEELARTGKKIFVLDMSDKPDKGAFQNFSLLPQGVECAVIGVTTTDPAAVMESLEKKGIRKFWVHWRTETPEVKKISGESGVQCITGRCPMMYLARGINMHTMHRGVAKLFGKY